MLTFKFYSLKSTFETPPIPILTTNILGHLKSSDTEQTSGKRTKQFSSFPQNSKIFKKNLSRII